MAINTYVVLLIFKKYFQYFFFFLNFQQLCELGLFCFILHVNKLGVREVKYKKKNSDNQVLWME